jgi:hypothetical protein
MFIFNMMNFGETYKKLPTAKLLEILNNKQDYRPEAIVAAELELKSRTDVDAANEELKEKAAEDEERRQKKNELKEKANEIIDTVDPRSKKTPQRIVTIICVVLLIYVLYRLYYGFEFILTLLDNKEMLNWYMLFFFVEFAFLPLALYFFYKRTKHGWYMLLIWLIYRIAGAIIGVYFWFVYYNTANTSPLYMRPNITAILVPLMLYGAVIYFICRSDTKALFKTEREMPDALDQDELD